MLQVLPEKAVKYGVFVAARTGSTRLPGKALLPLCGLPMLAYLLRRLGSSSLAGRVVLATTDFPDDNPLADLARSEGIEAFRGDGRDLVKRFVAAERAFPCEFVVRVTADCPFVDGHTLDHCLTQCEAAAPFDMSSTKGRFPVGIDYEIYRASRMREVLAEGCLDSEEREHLTLHLYRHPEAFRHHGLQPPGDWAPAHRALTVDTPEDYRFAARLAIAAGDWNAPVARILSEASR